MEWGSVGNVEINQKLAFSEKNGLSKSRNRIFGSQTFYPTLGLGITTGPGLLKELVVMLLGILEKHTNTLKLHFLQKMDLPSL